jgi:N-acyl-D-amino-acid deacylase
MQHPAHTAGSDGILVGARPHPRGWGTFARYLAVYVRELGVLSLSECVRHMTSLPAQRLGLADRGLVRPGLAADITVFDPAAVEDLATYDEPRRLARGFHHVAVNGQLVLDEGIHTGATPGRALRRSASST